MKYSVFLQEPFGFRPFWVLLGIGMILAAVLVFLAAGRLGKGEGPAKERGRSRRGRLRLWLLKRRYLGKVSRIEKAFGTGKCGCREAHQRLSAALRLFVGKVTGEKTDSMVLSDLAEGSYRVLGDLIGKMYAPEFARVSEGDVADMIRESRKLIRTWI